VFCKPEKQTRFKDSKRQCLSSQFFSSDSASEGGDLRRQASQNRGSTDLTVLLVPVGAGKEAAFVQTEAETFSQENNSTTIFQIDPTRYKGCE